MSDDKKIYLIGNGFDLHHNLKTKYSDFKAFILRKNPNLVNKIDDIFSDKGWGRYEIEFWSILEEMLETLSYIDEFELYQDAFDGSETDMDRATYWHDPKINADTKSEELLIPLEMKKYFDDWIDSIELQYVKKDKKLELDKTSFYLCFNYTETLQKVYKVPEEQVLHIHGKRGIVYILGHNGSENIPYKGDLWQPYDDGSGQLTSDEDIRSVEVKQSINDTYLNLFGSYYKNSVKLIEENKEWFDNFSNVDKVIIMGLSMGNEDMIYLEKIIDLVPPNCQFTIYYYKSKDYIVSNLGDLLDRFKVEYFEW